jgi:hypothetical protein
VLPEEVVETSKDIMTVYLKVAKQPAGAVLQEKVRNLPPPAEYLAPTTSHGWSLRRIFGLESDFRR